MYLTIPEIEQKYDGNWVFLINCRKGDMNEIIGGEVLAFDKQKQRVAEYWNKEYDSDTYFRYVGSIPEGMGVLL